jgi:diadenosine tetraphosphate (Ap4A) HIT family hydrolase
MTHQPFDSDAYERRSREGPCFVCLFAGGDPVQRADNELIYEDNEVVVFLDRFPTVEGYVLVCPRKHVEQVTGDLTEDEYAALQRWVYRVGEAIRRTLASERLYVLSLGSQQGNRHVHWHVVPLPPGVAYRDQQLALLAKSKRGVLAFDRQRNAALAARIRANLDTHPTRSTQGRGLEA